MTSLIVYLKLFGAALQLNAAAFSIVEVIPTGLALALVTVLLAGIATAAGQSVVLFINRVKPARALLSIALSSFFYVLGYFIWSASIWLLARLMFKTDDDFGQVLATVGLGYAPHIFAFLAFIPFMGMGLGFILSLWSFFAIVIGIEVGLELSFWQALIGSSLGFVLVQILERSIGYPLAGFADWLRARTAGVQKIRTTLAPQDLIKDVSRTALISLVKNGKS
ncbi:MAG: YIP1 family protein [Trueperaceae bacterium]|nr:YIP1 family protein [Trueperaceae bacterium]